MEDFYLSAKPRRKYKKRAPRPVYQFDLTGEFVYKHASPEVAAENLMVNVVGIKSAIKRKSCYRSRWYFSYNKDFKIPSRKYSHNSLLSFNKTFFIDPFLLAED